MIYLVGLRWDYDNNVSSTFFKTTGLFISKVFKLQRSKDLEINCQSGKSLFEESVWY